MLELQGKFGTAKVFTDVVDNESISQVINLLNQPYIEGSKVRMMPDIHAGAGCTIGTTMTIKVRFARTLSALTLDAAWKLSVSKKRISNRRSWTKLFVQEFRPVSRFAQKLIDMQVASTYRNCTVQRWSM